MPEYNQALIDYSVRNITTGDEEDIRVLELSPDEVLGFPAPVRDQVIALIDDAQQTGPHWTANQDRILELLLPYITDRGLYDEDYGAWENNVLEGVYDPEHHVTLRFPPEDVNDRVRTILDDVADAAVENWSEGHWEDFSNGTTVREVLGRFSGFIESTLELEDPNLDRPFMEAPLSDNDH